MLRSWAIITFICAGVGLAVQLTNKNYDVTEGQPFTITWTGATEPVTIMLKNGASNDLKDVETITSSGTGGSYTWTPESLPSGTYAFEITDSSGQVNYSPQFSYQGTGTTTVTQSSIKSSTSSSSPTTSSPTSTTERTVSTSATRSEATSSPTNSESSSTSSTKSESSTTSSIKSESTTSSDPTTDRKGSSTSETDAATSPTSSIDSPGGSGSLTTGTNSGGANTSTPSSGLSTPAKIGLGVASSVAGLALLALGAIFVYRRGKTAGRAAGGGENLAGLERGEGRQMAGELGGTPRVEMGTTSNTPEMAGNITGVTQGVKTETQSRPRPAIYELPTATRDNSQADGLVSPIEKM